jgi:hypothetical protein
MNRKNDVVHPKPNWRDLQRMEELQRQRNESENKRKKIKFFQRLGLIAGLMGVAYSLGFAPVVAKEFQSRKGQVSSETPDFEELKENFEKIWHQASSVLEENRFYAGEKAAKVVEEITPVVSKGAEQIQSFTDEVVDLLPTIGPNISNHLIKQETPVSQPSITRKLTPEEINESDSFFAKLNEPKDSTPVTEEEGDLKVTGTPTPLAEVDINPDFEGTLESSITYNSPFEYRETNRVMSQLGLNLSDIYYPAPDKIQNFNALYTEKDVLPIFPQEVNQWAPLVVDLCNKHNEINKESPNRQINPNFILAIMSIESQGKQGAESHMAAKGLMQITTPIAEAYGYNAKNIYKPENNIITSISFFADLKDMAIRLGLKGNDVYEYAVMFYNGGWNADKYFMTSRVEQILKSSSATSKVFNANDIEGVKEALLAVKGNINAEGNEYFTFGTRLTKVETLKYREKIVRFVVIAEIADELRDGLIKKGLSEEKATSLTRKFIKTSDFIKAVNKRVRSESGPKNYFEEKAAFESFLKNRFNIAEIPEYTDDSKDNPAFYLMYR